MGLTGRQWAVVVTISVALVGAGAALGFAAQQHKFQTVATGVIAPVSLLVSVVALTMSASQTISASRQAKYASDQARYAAEQTRLAALATAFSYQPVLLPVHDGIPVQLDQGAQPSYPAIEAFTVVTRSPGKAAFLVNPHDKTAEVSVRNIGRGPAIIVRRSLFDSAGHAAELEGHPAIGPDGQERYTAKFSPSSAPANFYGPQSPQLQGNWRQLISDRRNHDRVFLLVICYTSVAPEAQVHTLEAVFDPRGTGAWKVSVEIEKTPAIEPGPGLLA